MQARDHAQKMLQRKGKTLADVLSVLKVFRDNVDEEEGIVEEGDNVSPPQKEILSGLIAFLESC